jgi:hypothetical protein
MPRRKDVILPPNLATTKKNPIIYLVASGDRVGSRSIRQSDKRAAEKNKVPVHDGMGYPARGGDGVT